MAEELVVGYVPGAWDMFHAGHLNILRLARAACDYLVVGVVSDDVLSSAKGRRPMYPLAERMQVVSSLRLVDEVVLDTSSDKSVIWSSVRFDVLFKGDDWRDTLKGDRLEQQMAAVGAKVHYFPYTKHVSSTSLRKNVETKKAQSSTSAPRASVGHPAEAAARRPRVQPTSTVPSRPLSQDKSSTPVGRPFHILFVCEANRCRSPIAEYLLRRDAVAAGLRWEISSAGTDAVDGDPIDPGAAKVLLSRGIDSSRFHTRKLTRELCESADVIITVTDKARDVVASLAPSKSVRVFTLLPLAHLMSRLATDVAPGPVRGGQELLDRAKKARGAISPLRSMRDLPDPVGQRVEKFEVCADTVEKALVAIMGRDREA